MGTGSNQPFDIGHWILRLVALIIDGIILGIVAWVIQTFVLIPLVFTGAFWFVWGTYLVLPFILGILAVLYFTFLEASMWSASLGKKIIGLKVQLVKGGNVPFDKALIRNISKIHPLLLLLDWIVAVVTPGPDPRQKYSDRIAGTTVVQISAPLESLVSVPEEKK
jgi:uncharacterized RDD family membrane protein YckC